MDSSLLKIFNFLQCTGLNFWLGLTGESQAIVTFLKLQELGVTISWHTQIAKIL